MGKGAMAGHDVQYGKHRTRRSFSRIKEVLDLPNLIEIQTDSFKDFLESWLEGIFKMCFSDPTHGYNGIGI